MKNAAPTMRGRNEKHKQNRGYSYMGVQMSFCSDGVHFCKHRGSKPSFDKKVARRRAQNRAARLSRRANR